MRTPANHDSVNSCENGTGSTRREFIRTALGITVSGALIALPFGTFAAEAVSATDPLRGFIALSQAITEHRQIDSTLAARFYRAFARHDAQFTARIRELARVLAAGDSAQQLMEKATRIGLNDFLYQIVTAWYTGTVGNDYHGTLVAYRHALMYQPVSDGLVVPTYCGNGPIWWTAPVPDENDGLIASL